jgi:hypothetical protein
MSEHYEQTNNNSLYHREPRDGAHHHAARGWLYEHVEHTRCGNTHADSCSCHRTGSRQHTSSRSTDISTCSNGNADHERFNNGSADCSGSR